MARGVAESQRRKERKEGSMHACVVRELCVRGGRVPIQVWYNENTVSQERGAIM